LRPGQIGGIVVDANGASIPHANITAVNKQTGAKWSTQSDADGRWVIANALPGPTRVSVDSSGFKTTNQELNLGSSQPEVIGTTLEIGAVSEVVTVTGNNMTVDGLTRMDDQIRHNRAQQLSTPSANVANLQKRVAGILPVRIDVPKSGRSYRFVRTLVMDEETKISFNYKAR